VKAAVGLYGRLDVTAERARAALRGGLEGALASSLTPSEKSELTVYLYGLNVRPLASALSAWEREWYLKGLPPAPARVLLGAAGDGREAAWLCDAGYSVDAFEPNSTLASKMQRRLGARVRVARASYEDLVAARSGERSTPYSAWFEHPYDAVILGWGSLTHVLDPRDHRPLLAASDRLSPTGPILASFWLRDESPPEARQSRASTVGSAVGRRVAQWRGVRSRVPEGEVFRSHCGFAYEFTRAEIEGLAAAVGRSVEWGEYGYPHVTLVKSPARG
jgi:hypothetical protein